MKILTKASYYLFLLPLLLSNCSSESVPPPQQYQLWYDQPAAEWTDALPVGNGRLGAMIYGKTENEIIQFNEETLWTGQPHDYAHEGAAAYLDEIRNLLWEGKQQEAHELGNNHFMSAPLGQFCYQPFGDLNLHFSGHNQVENYRRSLDLDNAMSTVSYEKDGVKFTREVFASNPDQAIFIRLKSDQAGSINFSGSLSSPHERTNRKVEDGLIILNGQSNDYHREKSALGPESYYPKSKVRFESQLKIVTKDGEMISGDTSITVNNASEVLLILVAATSFVDFQDISGDPAQRCRETLAKINPDSYSQIKETHIEDYQSLYNRLHIDLGKSELSERPTHLRLETFQEDNDPNMVALLYQYGRYLLIASSRPGTQPANLQGIWNDRLVPPWDSKYTTNINTEMNYWLAEMTNLSECAEPLFQMVEDLSQTGQNIAKVHYGMDGWVFHHNADIWRGAAPINNANHGIWVTGGAWLCQHLWQHYQYSGNIDFLQTTAYPIMREASRFFTQYLSPGKDKSEWLVSGPSNSPEIGGLVMGPTMDHQLIRNLFANTIEAAEILGLDHEFVAELQKKRTKIAPNQIGQHGQLQEWLEDRDDPENKHRHVSHLWGLHPGNEIHPLTTPELAEACKVTLSHRGDGGTGWSRAWKINFWARLLDGDHSFLMLKNLIVPAGTEKLNYDNRGGLYRNLFDAHPPFQIDGNFGATSGITEMLMQTHLRTENGHYYLDILPALPSALPNGKITGLRTRGGFEVGFEWQNGTLIEITLKSLLGEKAILRYEGQEINLDLKKGETELVKFIEGKLRVS